MVPPILFLAFLLLALSFRRTLSGELGCPQRKRGFLRLNHNNVPRLVVNFVRVSLLFRVVPQSYPADGLAILH